MAGMAHLKVTFVAFLLTAGNASAGCVAEPFVRNAGAAIMDAAGKRSAAAFSGVAARYADLNSIALFALGAVRQIHQRIVIGAQRIHPPFQCERALRDRLLSRRILIELCQIAAQLLRGRLIDVHHVACRVALDCDVVLRDGSVHGHV